MQVGKWGNSLAVRLPSKVVKALDLRDGDEIEIVVEHPRGFAVRKAPDQQALLEQLRAFRGRLPADFIFSREEANQRD